MAYYIGVDGGGTKTTYALFNEHKEILRMHEGPGTNHENLEGSFNEAAALLWEGLQALLDEAGLALSDIGFTLMGLAGVDHPYQYDALMKRLRGYGLERKAPQGKALRGLEICNDGFIVVKAGCRSGAGIGLNLGTGTCCNAIDRRGRLRQLAGLGDFSGDAGNGSWIAVQAFRLVYDDVILGLAATGLTPLLFEAFGLTRPEELLILIEAIEEPGSDAAKTLIRLFFEAANRGDPAVLRLVEQMALRGAQLIVAHLRNLDFAASLPCEVVLSGSIHTKLPNDIYIELLKQKAAQLSGRELEFHKLEQPPVVGCINWILQEYA